MHGKTTIKIILSSQVIRPITPLQTVYYWKACTLKNRVTHNICYLKLHRMKYVLPVSKKFSFLLQLTRQMNHEPKELHWVYTLLSLSWILMFNTKKCNWFCKLLKNGNTGPLKTESRASETGPVHNLTLV
jgi:hypothetical protein